jgi:hypothetical protein
MTCNTRSNQVTLKPDNSWQVEIVPWPRPAGARPIDFGSGVNGGEVGELMMLKMGIGLPISLLFLLTTPCHGSFFCSSLFLLIILINAFVIFLAITLLLQSLTNKQTFFYTNAEGQFVFAWDQKYLHARNFAVGGDYITGSLVKLSSEGKREAVLVREANFHPGESCVRLMKKKKCLFVVGILCLIAITGILLWLLLLVHVYVSSERIIPTEMRIVEALLEIYLLKIEPYFCFHFHRRRADCCADEEGRRVHSAVGQAH